MTARRRRGRPRGTRDGAGTTRPKPFTVFIGRRGRVGVRIGNQKPFISVAEVIVSAAPVFITRAPEGLLIRGEGVVRRHRETIAITA